MTLAPLSISTMRSLFAASLLSVGGVLMMASVATPAHAAKDTKVYVNGTNATGMKNFEFTAVDVRIDSEGNIWIDAPRYRIEVSAPAGGTPTAPAGPETTPVAVAQGAHWLVTQDDGSAGQVVEVLVNGTSVREVRSGQAQLILDLGPFLKAGSNVVTFRPVAGDAAATGKFSMFIGEGSNDSGTLKMQNPQISYARDGAEPAGEKSVEYMVK